MTFSRIGVLGAGVMGEALIVSLIRSGIAPKSITLVEKRTERLKEICSKYGVLSGSLKGCEVVFLIVKPQDVDSALKEYRSEISPNSLMVTFVAGKTTSFIESQLTSGQRVIRVMPNTPMTFGKGFAAVSSGSFSSESDFQWLSLVLSKSNVVIKVAEEKQDAITALSGSGPAYFFALLEAMADAGKRMGLREEDAILAAKQVLIGSAAMIENSEKDPKTLRENVTSPNGTTFAALLAFQEAGFSEVVFTAMRAARDRSIELSK